MGDRTYVNIKFKPRDKQAVIDAFGCDGEVYQEPDAASRYWEWEYHDCNYGGYSAFEKLSGLGITFIGEWCAGSEYGPGHIASLYGFSEEVETIQGSSATPIIRLQLNNNGIPEIESFTINGIMRYYKIHRLTEIELGLTDAKPTTEELAELAAIKMGAKSLRTKKFKCLILEEIEPQTPDTKGDSPNETDPPGHAAGKSH